MHAIQSWVALPREEEEVSPLFTHHPGADLPVQQEGGVWMRLLAGEAFGLRSAVRTLSPLFYLHVALESGARVALPRQYSERGAYLVAGEVSADGQAVEAGHMMVFDRGAPAVVAAAAPSILMLLGGEPLGRRFIEWNFVSSSRERIEQAKADWRGGRMKLPDGDNSEFIPLPQGTQASAGPMS